MAVDKKVVWVLADEYSGNARIGVEKRIPRSLYNGVAHIGDRNVIFTT